MKKWLLLWTMALALGACSEKEGPKVWDADAMISLRAAKTAPSPKSRAEGHLTPREIVEQAWAIVNDYKDMQPVRGFADAQRDFVNERLLMWGTDIINSRLEYAPQFIEGKNTVLTRNHTPFGEQWDIDTIAYIPNRVLEAAQAIIKPAFERGDYETCYEAFDKAFTFIPITGAEYRALQARGEN